MESQSISPRINTSHMPFYHGLCARLIGRVGKNDPETKTAKLAVSDGKEVTISYDSVWEPPSSCVEVVGTVISDDCMRMECLVKLGDKLDMETVEGTIKVIHDPRFREVFFPHLPGGQQSLNLNEDPRFRKDSNQGSPPHDETMEEQLSDAAHSHHETRE
ncbi:hypothetical protein MPER_12983 [Moniliophthora perniciosa FA553]|nr:hypothetical protein MPER_12983 [Moniliophthora perniciosa FA553]